MKSLRDGKLSLDEAYARVKEGEVWLVGADIAEYPQATLWNHAPSGRASCSCTARSSANSPARPTKKA